MEGDSFIKILNKCVASATHSPEGELATLFWQWVCIDFQRIGHRAFARRTAGPADMGDLGIICRVSRGTGLLEVARGM